MAAVSRVLERPALFVDAGAHLTLVEGGTRRPAKLADRLRRCRPALATVALLSGLWFGTGLLSSGAGSPVAASPVHLVAGVDYVVKPGDTLASISQALDRRDPGRLEEKLRAELHNTALRPGEVLRVS